MVAVLRSGPPTQADFHEAIASRSDRWYSACLKITRNPDLAADAVQDALLNAWNKRHQFQQTAKLETWIHRIAVNAALALVRKRRPEAFQPLDTDIPCEDTSPVQALEDFELESDLARQLAALTDAERVCFILKHLEQWRAAEIAAEIGMNEGQVKQAVFRAVGKLRMSMQGMQESDHG